MKIKEILKKIKEFAFQEELETEAVEGLEVEESEVEGLEVEESEVEGPEAEESEVEELEAEESEVEGPEAEESEVEGLEAEEYIIVEGPEAEESEVEGPEAEESEVEGPEAEESEKLHVNKAFFTKKRIKTFVLVGTLLAGGLVGYIIGKSGKSKNDNNPAVSNPTSTVSTMPTEFDDQEKDPSSTEPIIDEDDILVLNAENFEETVQDILESNQKNGLNIDPTFIRSSLFITNIDYLSEDDIKKLYGNKELNIIEEIQNMYNYTSAVGTHNNNVALGNQEGSYISLADLSYDLEDKKILKELEQELTILTNNLSTISEEEYQNSFEYITKFYSGNGSLKNDYSIFSLTSGGGLLAEQYWHMFAVRYTSSEMLTATNQTDIESLTTNVINGSRWLGPIVNHESLNCLAEESKSLTKTQ